MKKPTPQQIPTLLLSASACLFACGASSPATTPAAPTNEQQTTFDQTGDSQTPSTSPATASPALVERASEGCRYVIDMIARDQCNAKLTQDSCTQHFVTLDDIIDEERRLETITCVDESTTCTEASQCFAAETAYRESKIGPRVCGEEGVGTIRLDQAEADGRYGLGATTFPTSPSTLEKPIEVCGLIGEVMWLTQVRCDDGSSPFSSLDQAHSARTGSEVSGGRCKSAIDRYQVTCPESTYEVFMDFYMCGPGESPR